jgi:Fe-S cluster assembly iron-binding protein IscA
MLQIRDSAETALRRIRSENDVPQDAAVRIGAIETLDGLIGIGFAFTDGPEDGDQTVFDRENFRVYLASELALSLTAAAIEATGDEEGVALQLRSQEELNHKRSA